MAQVALIEVEAQTPLGAAGQMRAPGKKCDKETCRQLQEGFVFQKAGKRVFPNSAAGNPQPILQSLDIIEEKTINSKLNYLKIKKSNVTMKKEKVFVSQGGCLWINWN
jgi:hypothetical protein